MSKGGTGRARLFWTAALALAAVIWVVVFAYWAAPNNDRQAHRGQSLAVLNPLIPGQASHPVTEYVADWENFANKVSFGLGVPAACALFVLGFGVGEPAEAPAGSAGVVRMSSKRVLIVYALGSDYFWRSGGGPHKGPRALAVLAIPDVFANPAIREAGGAGSIDI